MLKRFKGTKGMILLVLIMCLIVGYYYYLSNREVPEKQVSEETETLTLAQEVLLRNLETDYPQSPREVVKYFSEITKCFFNEELTEEEQKALGLKIREIYDEELVANQEEGEYLEALAADITNSKESKQLIVTYSPSSSLDVETFTDDGYDWARLYCIYGIKQGDLLYKSNIRFLLRKDEEGHYKIYGWELEEQDDSES